MSSYIITGDPQKWYILSQDGVWFLSSQAEWNFNLFYEPGSASPVGAFGAAKLQYNWGTAEFVPGSSNVFKLHGIANGASLEVWEKSLPSPNKDTNPATTAAKNAIIHAIMGVFANKDFYEYLLFRGYIYTHAVANFTLEPEGVVPPSKWYNYVKNRIYGLIGGTHFTFPIQGKPANPDVVHPILPSPPSYGTKEDPTYDPSQTDPTAKDFFKIPQGNSKVPDWVVGDWFSISNGKTAPTEILTVDLTGGKPGLVYSAEFSINADIFIDNFLERGQMGLVSYDPAQAALIASTTPAVTEVGAAQALEGYYEEQAAEKKTAYSVEKKGVTPLAGAEKEALEQKEWKAFFKDQISKDDEPLAQQLPIPQNIENNYPDATHYVLMKGLITGKPPQPKIIVDVRTRPTKSKKGEIVGTLINGDAVKVMQEYVGANQTWHRIKVVQQEHPLASFKRPLFANSKFLAKLPHTPYSLNRVYKCKNQKKFETPDWTKMQNKEVFFDKRKCNQCIVIEPTNPKTDKKYIKIVGNELEEAKQSALMVGVIELLKFYNKKTFDTVSLKAHYVDQPQTGPLEISTVEKVLGAFEGPYVSASDWYLDKRPESKLKILVKFPSKYFDALPENPEDFKGIAHTSTATLTLDPSDKEVSLVKDIYGLRTVHFVLPTLKEKIDIISKLMEFYAKKMDSWPGTIPGFDLRKEKQRLEDFSLALFQFLQLNGFTVDAKEEDTIELGYNGIFELQYVLINKTGFASPLRIGFEQFKNKDPINITRTMAYVFYLDDLIREARKKTKIGWIEFVQKYTFPVPEIKPSNIASALDSICTGTKGTKKEYSEKISKIFDKVETYTSRGMEEAQKKINNPTLKAELINIRKSTKNFVGDEFTRQIPDLLKRMDSIPTNLDGINELYSSILNKTDIKNLASSAASIEVGKMSFIDVSVALGEFVLEEMNTEELTKLYDSFPEIIKIKINNRMEEINMGIDIDSSDSIFFSDSTEDEGQKSK